MCPALDLLRVMSYTFYVLRLCCLFKITPSSAAGKTNQTNQAKAATISYAIRIMIIISRISVRMELASAESIS